MSIAKLITNILAAAGIIGGIVFICLMLFVQDNVAMVDLYLTLSLVSLGIGAVSVIVNYSVFSAEHKTDAGIKYNKDTGTLTVYAIKSINKNSIKVAAVKDYKLEYHPSETVYTGATVGGIHMGGFHQTEDYYTAKTWSTKRAQLVYDSPFESNNSGPIRVIEFSDKLMETLSFPYEISKFRDGNRLFLFHNDTSELEKKGLQIAAKNNDLELARSIYRLQARKYHLSYDECFKIRNFLGKKIKK